MQIAYRVAAALAGKGCWVAPTAECILQPTAETSRAIRCVSRHCPAEYCCLPGAGWRFGG